MRRSADRGRPGLHRAGKDWLELGNGSSQVRTGPDNDWVIVTAVPNGHDLIDLEEGESDVADYRLRREALTYVADDLANDGADMLVGEHGEEDNLEFVVGVDVTRFRASYPTPLPLELMAGDDRARGGGGRDRLYLDGGDDRGFGGPAADRIWGDAGRDRLLGQRGRNRLGGGTERDRCRGGSRRSVILRCEEPATSPAS